MRLDLTKDKDHIEAVKKFKEFLKLGDVIGREENTKKYSEDSSTGETI